MKQWFRPKSATASRRGVTLTEMLVIIGIIGILMMILLPSLGSAMEKARQAACGNNLGQCYKLVLQYATENAGRLPAGNASNPTRFYTATNTPIVFYMAERNLPSAIWYCPSLARQEPRERSPVNWINPDLRSLGSARVFSIGYGYHGAPEGPVAAYQVPLAYNMADLDDRIAVITDICSAPPGAAPEGRLVTGWTTFPHRGPGRPEVCKVATGSGSVNNKPKEMIVRSYSSPAITLYW